MDADPLVSVVLPIFEQFDCARAAIRSVLEQSLGALELIIVDDHSSKPFDRKSESIFADTRIKWLRLSSNGGPSVARNAGISAARGQYIAFIDADDVWLPGKLESQLSHMAAKATPISSTSYQLTTPYYPMGQLRPNLSVMTFDDLLWGCTLSPGSTLVAHKSVFDKIGLFDESLRRLEDWDWLLRCCKFMDIPVVPGVLAKIDVGTTVSYTLDQLLSSGTALRAKALNGKYGLTPRQAVILNSTLNIEMAASSYRCAAYLNAARFFVGSIYKKPFKRRGFYLRIFRAVMKDFF